MAVLAMKKTAKDKKNEETRKQRQKESALPTKVVSANTLSLRQGHVLMKSVLNFNQATVFKNLKEGCFGQEYDI